MQQVVEQREQVIPVRAGCGCDGGSELMPIVVFVLDVGSSLARNAGCTNARLVRGDFGSLELVEKAQPSLAALINSSLPVKPGRMAGCRCVAFWGARTESPSSWSSKIVEVTLGMGLGADGHTRQRRLRVSQRNSWFG